MPYLNFFGTTSTRVEGYLVSFEETRDHSNRTRTESRGPVLRGMVKGFFHSIRLKGLSTHDLVTLTYPYQTTPSSDGQGRARPPSPVSETTGRLHLRSGMRRRMVDTVKSEVLSLRFPITTMARHPSTPLPQPPFKCLLFTSRRIVDLFT